MGKKRTAYQKKLFESTGSTSDTSSNIYMSMLTSPAFRDLSAQQVKLYLFCKAQYYGEKRKPNDDPLCFTMNKSKWSGLYGLYDANNGYGFRRDMETLIEHGFVVCIECGALTRTKSIYRFSSEWQRWNMEGFVLQPSQMTLSMCRKRSKAAKP